MREHPSFMAVVVLTALTLVSSVRAQSPPLELRKGNRIVLLGNTMAERMQLFNHFETLLVAAFPDLDLVVRNLGWSGDTITLQPRPLNFGDAATHLKEQTPDVILAFFGLNESFAGADGLPAFEAISTRIWRAAGEGRYSEGPRGIALVSPMAQEQVARLASYVDQEARNAEIARYADTMREVAAKRRVTFVDLFTPTGEICLGPGEPLTINGIHVNEYGDGVVARCSCGSGARHAPGRLIPRGEVRAPARADSDKNQQFFYRWRPVNAEYVVGRRLEPFGAVNFPPEMRSSSTG